MPDEQTQCINVSSNNYLGYAQTQGHCIDNAIAATTSLGLSACSSSKEIGHRELHNELEKTMADFLGVEEVITFGTGYVTNVLNIPRLIGKDCLVLSDEFNHTSIIIGLRLSGATIKVFKHNDIQNLEQIMRKAIIQGHPKYVVQGF